jgi:hypothetical protein
VILRASKVFLSSLWLANERYQHVHSLLGKTHHSPISTSPFRAFPIFLLVSSLSYASSACNPTTLALRLSMSHWATPSSSQANPSCRCKWIRSSQEETSDTCVMPEVSRAEANSIFIAANWACVTFCSCERVVFVVLRASCVELSVLRCERTICVLRKIVKKRCYMCVVTQRTCSLSSSPAVCSS